MRVIDMLPAIAAGLALALTPAAAAAAEAELLDAEGNKVGTVELTDASGGVLIKGELTGLEPGPHGFHIHEVGQCEPPFESAGDHFNPADRKHGFMNVDGHHAGDMPNLNVPDSGSVIVEIFAAGVSLDAGETPVLDEDGAAVVVHAGKDDYESDPSGDSGDRIACGVIQ